MITFSFDIKKAVQIVNFLLNENGGRLNYTKLIKLLYISDKEFLKMYDMTISGDQYVSMNNGPVLSKIYNLVKGEDSDFRNQAFWDCLFCRDQYDLIRTGKHNMPLDRLSKAELEILESVNKRFKRTSYSKMIKYTHDKKTFPEVQWDTANNSRIPLSVEDILRSVGRSDEEIAHLTAEVMSQRCESEFFAECRA